MSKLLCTEEIDWKGIKHRLELHQSETTPTDYPVTQSQAIPLLTNGTIVLYRHIDGYLGLPGGQIEGSEDPKDALTREMQEECACKTVAIEQIGYLKDINEHTGTIEYQNRYAALVEALDEPVDDPAGKALERVIAKPEDVLSMLGPGWGQRTKYLIELAQRTTLK